MIERDLYPAIINGVRAEGGVAYRIGDSPFGKKPFDIGGISRSGQAIAIEVKIGDGLLEFDTLWKRLPLHQQSWLHHIAQHNGRASLCYYDRISRTMQVWHLRWIPNENVVKPFTAENATSSKHAGKRAFLGGW